MREECHKRREKMPLKPHVATHAEVWAMLTDPELELEIEGEGMDDI